MANIEQKSKSPSGVVVLSPEVVKKVWDGAFKNYLPEALEMDRKEKDWKSSPKFARLMKRKHTI